MLLTTDFEEEPIFCSPSALFPQHNLANSFLLYSGCGFKVVEWNCDAYAPPSAHTEPALDFHYR